ncbi:MAG: sigma-70 family RNA polymerase sigma factor [candidate division Zixibacteria bacterium]|nr:sigma-70 family RNA polymerase sigma factor [candidate division Zixibacteria bacterium]
MLIVSMIKPDNLSKQSPLSDPGEWVEKHGDALFGYAFRYVSDRTIAEDLVQETLLAALKGRASYSGVSSEQTWLIGILKNKVVDHYRKAGRETQLDRPEQFSDSDDSDYISTGPDIGSWQPQRRPAAWSVDPNDPIEQKQFWDHLHRCLEGLDKRLAKVYSLREIEEVDYKEVCNVLAVTPTNLRVMLHRARKLLRRCLETEWIEN